MDLSGRITLGEGSVLLCDKLKQLLHEGNKWILLNLRDVRYIDSSGVGELVSANTRVVNAGGQLKILDLTKKVSDLLQITKFYTIFDVFNTSESETEDDAIASFKALTRCGCPVCGYFSRPPLVAGKADWQVQTCKNPSCAVTFTVLPTADFGHKTLVVGNVRIETYRGEYFEIRPGRPAAVTVVGRLDAFSSSALRRVRQAFPAPRKILFELGQATDIDESGRATLFEFVRIANADKRTRVTASLEGLSPDRMGMFLGEQQVYLKRSDAVSALGDLSNEPLPLVNAKIYQGRGDR